MKGDVPHVIAGEVWLAAGCAPVRLAPDDLPIWGTLAELCAILGEDAPAYGGRSVSGNSPRPVTLEEIAHFIYDHRPVAIPHATSVPFNG